MADTQIWGLLRPYLSWSSITVLIVSVYLATCIKQRYFSPISDIPGPPLASFSQLWQIMSMLRGDEVEEFYELHRKHGPFVRIGPNEISVSHEDAPKQILLAPLDKGPWYRSGALPDYRFQTTLSTTGHREKVARARNFMHGYSLTNLLTMENVMNGPFALLLDWMDKFAESGKPMDLDKFFTYTAADITGELLFSKPFGFIAEGRDIDNTLSKTHKLVGIGTVSGYYPWTSVLAANPLVTWTGALPFSLLYNTAMHAIADREKHPDARFDIFAHWYKAREEHPDRITMRDIQAQATLGIIAGTDAMSTGLQTFVYHMLRHPTAWREARDEITKARAEGLCNDRVVSYADSQRLPYLQLCIKESLRLFGPLGTALPRVAGEQGVKIGDRTFPKGTTLSIHPFTMMQDKKIWGEDAREFKPERWLEADAASKEKFYMPFGLGYGQCPGIHLGKMELSKLAATIVRDYDIRQVIPGQKWKYEAYFNTLPHDWPVYVTKAGK